MTTAYPLTWPEGWPRTERPGGAGFRTALAQALNNVNSELVRFAKDSGKQVSDIMISSNYSLSDQSPTDAAVAVYFTWDDISTCIAVDRYHKLEHNLQAIFHCLEAERTKLRHGGINLVRAAFRGYAALPPPGKKKRRGRHWSDVLNISRRATRAEVSDSYRRLARTSHPDNGGSTEAMAKINQARDDALNEVLE